MASVGLNVSRDGRHSPGLIRSVNATWIRIVAMSEHDLTDYFRDCQAAGIRILLVIARESGGDLALYRRRYAGLIDVVQVGNEPDLVSPSSWTMTPVELASLGRSVRAIFPDVPIVCAGMASGHASWLDGADLSWCDAIACLVPDQRVTARAPTSASMRDYQGEVVTIKTAGGNQVTCTPNHPILTRDGWLPASAVKVGSQVAYDTGANRAGTWGPDDVQVPTAISEVFRALNHVGQVRTRRGLPLDFHGDGQDGDVHVVRADRFLRDAFAQHRANVILQVPSPVRLALTGNRHHGLNSGTFAGATEPGRLRLTARPHAVPMPLEQHVDTALLDAEIVGYGTTRLASGVPLVQCRDSLGGPVYLPAPRTDGESPLLEFLRQFGMAYPGIPRDGFESIPTGVAFVEVSHVSVGQYHGAVYNLSTEDQVIVADGIITHNCHPYLKDAPNPDDLEDLPDVPILLADYQRFGKPLLVTEWGWWGAEEGRATEEVRDMIEWAGKTDLLECFFYFCISDDMVPPFGLLDAQGREKPRARAFKEQAALAVHSLWPEALPEPEPIPVDLRAYARSTATRAGIDPETFVRQIQQESGFDPNAHNAGSGADGIAQIIVRWHPEMAGKTRDPIASLDYAATWMAQLRRQYGTYQRALAAYNWGPGNVAAWDGRRETLPAETRHYLDVILGAGWPEPSSAPALLPYNPDAPVDRQPDNWSCALESTRWLLRSIGRDPSRAWMEQSMVPGVVSPFVGLVEATGRGLAAWLTREYGTEMGFVAQYDAVTFDDVLAGAGVNPTLIGGRRYGPAGHWVGVRRADENGWLELANPSPNFTGTGTHLDRAEWEARGPWSAVWLDRMAALPAPDPPAPNRIAVLIREIEERLAELKGLVA